MTQRTGGLAVMLPAQCHFTAPWSPWAKTWNPAQPGFWCCGRGADLWSGSEPGLRKLPYSAGQPRKPDSENYDPRQNQERHAAPILAPNGEIAGYRYMMDLETPSGRSAPE